MHRIKASLEFEGPVWTNYDTTFRRQAATMGKENWSSLNSSLFLICFTTMGKCRSKCDDCLRADHIALVSALSEKSKNQGAHQPRGNSEQIMKGVACGQDAKGSMMGTVLI